MEHGETDDIPMELQKSHGISIILVPISNKNWLYISIWLVHWNMNFMAFYILGMSSSQLTFIFFRRVGIPPTSHVLMKIPKYPPVN
jgi:hypothetical protein